MTLKHLAHAAYHTLAISLPTLREGEADSASARDQDRRLKRWAQRILDFAQVELEVVSEVEPAPDEAFVVMSNHQSLYDIPAVYAALPLRLRMVAKKELFAVPVWGTAMRRAGMIELDRENHAAALASLERARAALARGTSIWIAPEGTRSSDGRLGTFKKGGFRLALAAGARILPVTVDGTWRVLSTQSRVVHPRQHVRVVVHAPIVVPASRGDEEGRDEEPEQLAALMQAVQQSIQSGLSSAA